jgi:hypothetical protein
MAKNKDVRITITLECIDCAQDSEKKKISKRRVIWKLQRRLLRRVSKMLLTKQVKLERRSSITLDKLLKLLKIQ